MKPRVYRGGKPNQVTFYLHIPADIVKALEISPDDEFELKVDKNGDEITLCYKSLKASPFKAGMNSPNKV